MSSIDEKFKLPKKFQGKFRQNIWSVFTQMVATYKPLDLTIGCPDFPPHKHVTEALAKVADLEFQHSNNPLGQNSLLQSLAELYSKLLKRDINPGKELITMATGCQSLQVAIMSLIEDDDEVVIIEPYFDFYETLVNMAGGKCRFVPLRFSNGHEEKIQSTSDWTLDFKELESVFNENTKLFILNTPNNPSGKVFTLTELSIISELCKKWNVVVLADEVYEFFVYPPHKHIRIATLPGMWERTITMVCPGKTFGVSGWELGVAYSCEELINKLVIPHQLIVHTNNIPIQEAYALLYKKEVERLHKDDSTLTTLPKNLRKKRDLMVRILTKAGMNPIVPEGGFLILANWTVFASKLGFRSENGEPADFQFAKWLIKNFGLAVIPTSSFYSEQNKSLGESFVRICFHKKFETIEKFENIMNKCSKTP